MEPAILYNGTLYRRRELADLLERLQGDGYDTMFDADRREAWAVWITCHNGHQAHGTGDSVWSAMVAAVAKIEETEAI